MKHNFVIEKALDSTIRVCTKCGLTHRFVVHRVVKYGEEIVNKAAWEMVTEEDEDGKATSIPYTCPATES